MTDSTILISIIMPAYNASAFIAESIDSVLNQTYKNWELIVIDDGSTDSTAKITKNKAAQDCRIKYYYQENGKQAKARNTGMVHAKGELIAFLDADDLWLKEKLEIMVSEFSAGNQDLLFSEGYIFENSFNIDNISEDDKKMGVVAAEYYGNDGLSAFLDMNKIPILSVVAKSDVIKKYRFNEMHTPAEDYDLWLRMLIGGCRFRGISQPLVAYRLHSASSSAGDRLVTDTIIKIIYSLKQSISESEISALIDLKLKKWLSWKLYTIEDYKQLKLFSEVLHEYQLLKSPRLIAVLNALSHLFFRINKRLLSRML